MLRQFTIHLDGDLVEDVGAAKLSIDNKNGKGSITLYEVFPGLTAWVYNINFVKDLVIDLSFTKVGNHFFGYNVVGHQMQKFPHEKIYKEITQGQNFIIVGEPGTKSEFIVPGSIHYECCYLIINAELLAKSEMIGKRRLETDLNEIFSVMDGPRPYRYFGNIDARTGTYAKLLTESDRTDLIGRLLVEGAIMNMLASQMEAHDHDNVQEGFQPDLSKQELSRIMGVGDFVRSKMSERFSLSDISRHLGLSPKKIQSGIRFLYGYSANTYITNIRLEHAKELFYNTNKSVSEVCYEIGYSSRSYFSKVFQERFGILPNEFKKSFLGDELLFEISYRSMAADRISGIKVDEIVDTARQRNESHNISGSLIYHRRIFFQIIEGPKREVLQLFENICNDERHTDIRTMWKGYKPKRDFGLWAMAMISDDDVFSLPSQGSTKELELGNLLGNLDDVSLASENLWRKVRNMLRISIAS